MATSDVILLDGAVGTELTRRGVATTLPLWSAAALIETPQEIEAIHADYLRAGAQWMIANTFRTHERTLAQGGLAGRGDDVNRIAIQCATRAIESTGISARILGSVAPLEDCYEPDRAPDAEMCSREHRRQIDSLLRAGADAVILETMGTARESIAAARAAAELAPGRWALSFCTRGDEPTALLSGESLVDVIAALDDLLESPDQAPIAVGVNCAPAPVIEQSVAALRGHLPAHVPILAYGNVGAPDPVSGWRATDAADPEAYAAYAMRWVEAGASIIGGCCGTTPATIRAMQRTLGRA